MSSRGGGACWVVGVAYTVVGVVEVSMTYWLVGVAEVGVAFRFVGVASVCVSPDLELDGVAVSPLTC